MGNSPSTKRKYKSTHTRRPERSRATPKVATHRSSSPVQSTETVKLQTTGTTKVPGTSTATPHLQKPGTSTVQQLQKATTSEVGASLQKTDQQPQVVESEEQMETTSGGEDGQEELLSNLNQLLGLLRSLRMSSGSGSSSDSESAPTNEETANDAADTSRKDTQMTDDEKGNIGNSIGKTKKQNQEDPTVVMGIDLGTSYSGVGIIENGEPLLLSHENSTRLVPSCVAFEECKDDSRDYNELVGKDAAEHYIDEEVVFGNKRLMGQEYGSPEVQKYIQNWKGVVINDNGRAKYKMRHKEKDHTFFPEQISASVLKKLSLKAQEYTDKTVSKAIITVPANFNQNQLRATRQAAEIAGIQVLDLLSEPCAAAVSYAVTLPETDEKTVLVFDFGGGTLDVTIMKIKNRVMEVLAVAGDSHLGGDDIDETLAQHCLGLFNNKYNLQFNRNDTMSWRRLKAQCEKSKRLLSKKSSVNICLDLCKGKQDFHSSIGRTKFEELCAGLFERAMKKVDEVVKESKLSKEDITEILLAGGSSKIPRIQSLLLERMGHATFVGDYHMFDHYVTIGATIMAANQAKLTVKPLYQIEKLVDVLPLSLGFEASGGRMVKIFSKNDTYPTEKTMIFSTDRDNRTNMKFKIYEGERDLAKDNVFLGEVEIGGIIPAPAGTPRLKVKFQVNGNGTFSVSAPEMLAGTTKTTQLDYNMQGLTKDERNIAKNASCSQ